MKFILYFSWFFSVFLPLNGISQKSFIPIPLPGCFNCISGNPSKAGMEVVNFPRQIDKYADPLRIGFRMKSQLKAYPDCKEIKKLIDSIGLSVRSKYNPDLAYDFGNVSELSEQGLQVDYLILELAIRKITIDVLEENKFTIIPRRRNENPQGILSWVADTIRAATNAVDQWEVLRDTYLHSLSSEQLICIGVDSNFLIVKAFRFSEMNDSIARSPHLYSLEKGDLASLAKFYEIPPEGRHECNPGLFFIRGDFEYIYSKYDGNAEMINKEIAAYRILFDAADLDNIPCFKLKTKGQCTWIVENFIMPRLSVPGKR